MNFARKNKSQLLVALGVTITRHRSRLGYSQKELASAVQMHRSYLSAIEHGERNISMRILTAIARQLSTTPAALVQEAEVKLLATASSGPASLIHGRKVRRS